MFIEASQNFFGGWQPAFKFGLQLAKTVWK